MRRKKGGKREEKGAEKGGQNGPQIRKEREPKREAKMVHKSEKNSTNRRLLGSICSPLFSLWRQREPTWFEVRDFRFELDLRF